MSEAMEQAEEQGLILAASALKMLTDSYEPCSNPFEADMQCDTEHLAKEMSKLWLDCEDDIMLYLPQLLDDAGFKTAVIHDFDSPRILWLFKLKMKKD